MPQTPKIQSAKPQSAKRQSAKRQSARAVARLSQLELSAGQPRAAWAATSEEAETEQNSQKDQAGGETKTRTPQ